MAPNTRLSLMEKYNLLLLENEKLKAEVCRLQLVATPSSCLLSHHSPPPVRHTVTQTETAFLTPTPASTPPSNPWNSPKKRRRFVPPQTPPPLMSLCVSNPFQILAELDHDMPPFSAYDSNALFFYPNPPQPRPRFQRSPRYQPLQRRATRAKSTSPLRPRPPTPLSSLKVTGRQIAIVGDSHVRDCRPLLQRAVGTGAQVTSSFMPGAPASVFVECLTTAAKALSPDDVIVVVGGSNNFDQDLVTYTQRLRETLPQIKQKILFTGIPPRFDDPASNVLIEAANKSINEELVKHSNVTKVNVNLTRNFFTSHGFHLNHSGKRFLCSEIAEAIFSFLG